MTLRAVILGLILSVVMGAANVYLGLKAGMTVSASIPAAVLAMVFLRCLFRNGTILECNQVQTAASAGESLAAGIIFTMPAMILIRGLATIRLGSDYDYRLHRWSAGNSVHDTHATCFCGRGGPRSQVSRRRGLRRQCCGRVKRTPKRARHWLSFRAAS